MKKNSIIVFLFLFVLSLTSCGKKEVNEMNLTKDFIVTSTPINKISMTDYRLEDLYSFFGESSLNENLVFDNGTKIITLNQVNQAFPIECLRTGGDNFYTIYKVLEGGFFYVFWSEALTNNIDENNVYVYFSTYINSLKNKNDFKNLKEGDTAIAYLPGHYGTIVDYNAKKDKYLLMDPHYLPKRGTSSFGDWVSQKDLEEGTLMVQTFFYYKAE